MDNARAVRDYLIGKFSDLGNDHIWAEADASMVYVDAEDDTVWLIHVVQACVIEKDDD